MDLLGYGPHEEAVSDSLAIGQPGSIPWWCLDTQGLQVIEIEGQQGALIGASVRLGECRGDVIADVERPWSALDRLPIQESRLAVAIKKHISHMGVAVD